MDYLKKAHEHYRALTVFDTKVVHHHHAQRVVKSIDICWQGKDK